LALCLSASQLGAICQRRDRLLSLLLYDQSRCIPEDLLAGRPR
jgi:hypothetical protein